MAIRVQRGDAEIEIEKIRVNKKAIRRKEKEIVIKDKKGKSCYI